MLDANDTPIDTSLDAAAQAELAHQQALRYGEDLARIFVSERQKRQQLEIAYQALDTLFANTPSSIILLDDQWIIQQANRAFMLLLDLEFSSVIGKSLPGILHAEPLMAALRRAADTKQGEQEIEFRLLSPVKREMSANIQRLQSGSLQGWVVVLHDQSNRKRLEYQKSEFINIAAHELRTPLGSIIGYGDLLRMELEGNPNIDPVIHEYAEQMAKAARRLTHVVHELIQFAELSQGEQVSHGLSTFVLADVVRDVFATLQQNATLASVSLSVKHADPALTLYADPHLLRSALYQLVLNAINFNHKGGHVSIDTHNEGRNVMIRVVDDGVGIPKEYLEAIFQPFFQVEDHNTRRMDGMGLGLPITQRAVAQLGGKLSLTSELGKGSTFVLTLPRVANNP
jgi:two-component system, OmpR family, phosphate regulon sensor histidine kinase PhoR